MSQVIRISDELFERLEAYASGFDTPSNVIETILNAYEGRGLDTKPNITVQAQSELRPATSLEIRYEDGSEEAFKRRLLENKRAFIKLHYTNDTTEIKEWAAFRFSPSSSVDGNLRSGYLRGWKRRGVFKAELSIHRFEN